MKFGTIFFSFHLKLLNPKEKDQKNASLLKESGEKKIGRKNGYEMMLDLVIGYEITNLQHFVSFPVNVLPLMSSISPFFVDFVDRNKSGITVPLHQIQSMLKLCDETDVHSGLVNFSKKT